jgi:hypothetical protein
MFQMRQCGTGTRGKDRFLEYARGEKLEQQDFDTTVCGTARLAASSSSGAGRPATSIRHRFRRPHFWFGNQEPRPTRTGFTRSMRLRAGSYGLISTV